MNRTKIGVLGGGQLGRMLAEAAIPLDLQVHFLDTNPNGPCGKSFANFHVGDFNNYEDVMKFGLQMDSITIEIEHVNIEALKTLKAQGKKVFPSPEIIEIIQDKGLQKEFYAKHHIPTSSFYLVDEVSQNKLTEHRFPFVQKLRKGGYDGKGVAVIQSDKDGSKILPGPSVIERKIDFVKELAVIVNRSECGEVKTFPTTEMEFNPEANLVEFLFSPANVNAEIEKEAQALAMKCAEAFELVGTLAVELFLLEDGSLLVNECAPRVHNSGHHTIEANFTSQFQQHLRAISNLPLGDTSSKFCGVMINLLGHKDYAGIATYKNLNEALSLGNVYPHLYGKEETRPFRKMGHVTITDKELELAKAKARRVLELIQVVSL